MGVQCRHNRDFSKISANKINNLRKVTTLKPSVGQKKNSKKNHAVGIIPKNKYHCLLADPPGIDISKISEDANKKSNQRLFPQLPSDEKAVDEICKFWSLGHGYCLWARIAQTFPVTSKRALGKRGKGRLVKEKQRQEKNSQNKTSSRLSNPIKKYDKSPGLYFYTLGS
jgi:hypothetical protein